MAAPEGNGGGMNEQMKNILELAGMGASERPGTPEHLLSENKPELVTLGIRMLELRELEYLIRELVSPNPYAMDFAIRSLSSRAMSVDFLAELAGIEIRPSRNEPPLSPEDKEKLAESLDKGAMEAAAFRTIVEDYTEDDILRDDLENATVKAFLSPGKKETPARAMKIALESGPTWEGEVEFGQKVTTAIEAYIKIGRGEAVATFDAERDKINILQRTMGPNGVDYDRDNDAKLTRVKTGSFQATFPNIWAVPENYDLFDLAYKKVVKPHLDQIRGDQPPLISRAAQKLREKDDLSAAMYAYVIFKTLRLNLKFALGTRGIGAALNPEDITPEDLALLNLDSNDDRQKLFIAVRARLEHGGKLNRKTGKFEGKRDHERAAGSLPVIKGCIFSMVATVPELTTTMANVEKVEYLDPNDPTRVTETVDVRGTGKIIRTSIYDACFNGETTVMQRLTNNKGDTTTRLARYTLTPRSFRDVWDGVIGVTQAVKEADIDGFTADGLKRKEGVPATREVNGRQYPALEVIKGLDNNAVELPFGLMAFYAYQLWDKMMGIDYKEQLAGILSTGGKDGHLKKWNKYMDVVLAFLGGAYGIDSQLQAKLSDYTRVMYLAGVGAATIVTNKDEPIQRSQLMKPVLAGQATVEKSDIIRAARLAGFVATGPKGEVVDWNQKLYDHVVDTREAPTPFDLQTGSSLANKVGFSFDRSELEKLLPLYPFSRIQV